MSLYRQARLLNKQNGQNMSVDKKIGQALSFNRYGQALSMDRQNRRKISLDKKSGQATFLVYIA